MVSTRHRLVMLISVTGSSNRRARVRSVVRRAVIIMPDSRGRKTARDRDSADFRVAQALGAAVALPKLSAGALGVAVGGAGTERLLLLVVASEAELDEGGDEEEERAQDGDGEAGGVETAGGAERGGVGDLVALAVAAEAFLGVG